MQGFFFHQLQVSVRLDFLSSDNKLNLLSIYQQQGPPGPRNPRKLQTATALAEIKTEGQRGVLWQFYCFLKQWSRRSCLCVCVSSTVHIIIY